MAARNANHATTKSRARNSPHKPAYHRYPLIVTQKSSWMTKWTTLVTAPTTSALTRTRATRVATVALAHLPRQVPVLVASRVAVVAKAATTMARAPVQVVRPAARNAAVRVMAAVVSRAVTAAEPAIVVRTVTINRASQPCAIRVKASRNRRSCTKSRRSTVSRLPNSLSNCQAVHVARNLHC
ncbi:hypothetical protein D3C79_883800 [compost metagenome]